ncbi:MAG: PD-(D/E)XK nuclease family protein [Acidimicrobiaceae bacterium]|nr:PD-(D/E)XK nuclease family protein [Acidimicrobiaceae bacterium]
MQQLSFRLVGYGQPACDELEAFVRDAKADDPFAPVTVVVHNNYEGVALRRELTRRRAETAGQRDTHRGLVAIEFRTLQRLADELGSADLRSRGRRPVNELVVAAAIRQELADSPGIFAGIAEHAATESSLTRAFAEVRSLRSDQRQRLQRSDSARVREVTGFVERVSARLAADRYFDDADLLEHVVGRLGRSRGDLAAQLQRRFGRTVLHLPARLSPVQVRFVRALAAVSDLVVHLGATGNPEADRPARELHAALSSTADPVDPDAAPSDPSDGGDGVAVCATASSNAELFASTGIDESTADCVISVTDPDDEVRTVVRSVLEDLDAGVAAHDIAILIGARDPYARSLTEQLDVAGIAWNGDAAQSLAESLVGRFALRLVRLAVDQQMRRVEVMAMLAEAPVWQLSRAGDSGGGRVPVPAAAWERLARAANVVEADDWVSSESHSARAGDPSTRLGRFMLSLDAQIAADESDPEAGEARLDRLRQDRDRCGSLADFIFDLSQRIDQVASLRSWDDLSSWLRRQVAAYLGRTTSEDWIPGAQGPETGVSRPTPAGLADDTEARLVAERTAAQRIDGIIEGLSSLESIEPAADASLLLRTLQSQLASPHGLSGRVGTGVFVGRVGSHAGVPRHRLYVLGLAEGIYPTRQLPDSLIGDADRHRGALIRRSERTDAQHRDLLAALACCTGQSTVTIPRGDLRRNAESVPSRWLLPTARRLAAAAEHPSDDFSGGYLDASNLTSAAASGSIDGLRVSHSFMSGLANARFPATEAEFDSRELLTANASGNARGHWLFTDRSEPAFANGVALWRGRQTNRFTRFDGDLSQVVDIGSGLAEIVSASRLEAWATCPRKYLFSYMLGIDEIIEPESVVRLSPIDRGQLIHDSLDELLRELIDAAPGPQALPGPGRSYSSGDRSRLEEIGAAKAERLEAAGATGYPLLWSFDRETMLADLVEVLDRDELRPDTELAATRGKVVASEHRFGLQGSSPDDVAAAVPFEVELGRHLLFRGAIDRVERLDLPNGDDTPAGGERLVVIDYKSGSERPYLPIREPSERARRADDPTLRGTKLQLGVYALAAAHHFAPGSEVSDAVHQAAYWFVSARADWAWVARRMNLHYFERFEQVVRSITRGIDAGIFIGYVRQDEDHAGFTPCPYCNPDGISTADILRQWQRKRTDGGLADFAHLVEGPIGADA